VALEAGEVAPFGFCPRCGRPVTSPDLLAVYCSSRCRTRASAERLAA